MDLTLQQLQDIAAKIGLTQVGVSGPERVAGLFDLLEKRRAEGRISPFEEKEPLQRIHPGTIFEGCSSVIALAVPFRPKPHRVPLTGTPLPKGLVAACARGLDYHLLAKEKAEALISAIAKKTGSGNRFLIHCDRGPLVERALAVKAGLGIHGNNCTLINPEYGSYTALALILTGVDIEPGRPLKGGCSNCRKCLEQCPTGALLQPGVLDYRRCLSYLTQASGEFPHQFRPLLGRRIYGCDSCQECCPHNKEAAYSLFPEASLEFFPGEPDLKALLEMTRKEYDLTIGLTSAGWRGKTTLQRNTVIAAGNTKNPDMVKLLLRLLENDRRPVIRGHAAWALGQIGGTKSVRGLQKALPGDPEETVRVEARIALEKLTS